MHGLLQQWCLPGLLIREVRWGGGPHVRSTVRIRTHKADTTLRPLKRGISTSDCTVLPSW